MNAHTNAKTPALAMPSGRMAGTGLAGRPGEQAGRASRAPVPGPWWRRLGAVWLWLALLGGCAHESSLQGAVVRVADGDTVTVRDQRSKTHRVRLAGIDAPEQAQPHGAASRQHLVQLVAGREVEVRYAKTDDYGRLVGTLWLDGRDVNLAQLQAGLAWHYRHYQDEQPRAERQAYAEAEAQARQARLGLWQDPAATGPWDSRQQRRQR